MEQNTAASRGIVSATLCRVFQGKMIFLRRSPADNELYKWLRYTTNMTCHPCLNLVMLLGQNISSNSSVTGEGLFPQIGSTLNIVCRTYRIPFKVSDILLSTLKIFIVTVGNERYAKKKFVLFQLQLESILLGGNNTTLNQAELPFEGQNMAVGRKTTVLCKLMQPRSLFFELYLLLQRMRAYEHNITL